MLAVIKANGYGHGLPEVAKALRDEAQLFGVANVEEASQARSVVPHPIIILGPALPAERVRDRGRWFYSFALESGGGAGFQRGGAVGNAWR